MKKRNLIGIGILAAALLAGCGASQTTQSTAQSSAAPAGEAAGQESAEGASEAAKGAASDTDFSAILSKEPSGKKIVVATNNASGGRDAWLLERAKEAGFQIEIVPLGGGDITARVISEVNNPTTNVVWGPSEDQFTSMIEANALAPFTPDWAEDVAGVSKENGYSWPYEIQPKLLICNPDTYTEETAPKSYQDLWTKEEFKGKYAVPTSFEGNTNRAIVGGILAQYLDESGELGVSEEGWDAIKAYFANGYKTPKGEDDFGNMASGKVPVTFTFASGLKGKMESFGVTPRIIYTEAGEPTNTNQIGVVQTKEQEAVEESMRFANWLGSADIIGAYAKDNGNIVANKKAESQMSDIAKEIKANYKPQEADWAYINSMMDEWVAKIQLELY